MANLIGKTLFFHEPVKCFMANDAQVFQVVRCPNSKKIRFKCGDRQFPIDDYQARSFDVVDLSWVKAQIEREKFDGRLLTGDLWFELLLIAPDLVSHADNLQLSRARQKTLVEKHPQAASWAYRGRPHLNVYVAFNQPMALMYCPQITTIQVDTAMNKLNTRKAVWQMKNHPPPTENLKVMTTADNLAIRRRAEQLLQLTTSQL